MNWTGGRLQRHSKANANTSLKRQRQHFAKARLHQQNGQPFSTALRAFSRNVPLYEDQATEPCFDRGLEGETSGAEACPLTLYRCKADG